MMAPPELQVTLVLSQRLFSPQEREGEVSSLLGSLTKLAREGEITQDKTSTGCFLCLGSQLRMTAGSSTLLLDLEVE